MTEPLPHHLKLAQMEFTLGAAPLLTWLPAKRRPWKGFRSPTASRVVAGMWICVGPPRRC